MTYSNPRRSTRATAALTMPAVLALSVGLAGCATGPAPNKRVPLHDPDPRCPANLAPLVPEAVVSRAEIDHVAAQFGLPAGYGRGVSGLYFILERRILIADDMHGWRLAHVLQWERCRAWLHLNAGSPLMAWEIRARGVGTRSAGVRQ